MSRGGGAEDDGMELKQFVTCRNLFQLHHVHGGVFGSVDDPHPELPSQECRHPRNVRMGKEGGVEEGIEEEFNTFCPFPD